MQDINVPDVLTDASEMQDVCLPQQGTSYFIAGTQQLQ